MKQFSNIKNTPINNISNEDNIIDIIKENISYKVDSPLAKNIDIELNIDEKLSDIIMEHYSNKYKKDIKTYLEKMKLSFYTKDIEWIENEINKFK